MSSDSALREKLKALKGVSSTAAAAVPPSPAIADQVQRLRVARSSNSVPIEHHAQLLDAQIVAPGVLLCEQELPLTYRHGAEELSVALNVTLDHLGDVTGCLPRDAIFIDTETTGLAGGTGTLPFLVGMAQFTATGVRVRQYLLTGFSGEAAMLETVVSQLPAGAPLVSFNGKTFDVPLLSTRLRLARLRDVLSDRPHIDLVHITRRAFAGSWPDCRLVTAETQLVGFTREDDISGAEVPQVWFDFVRFNHTKKLRAVLRHNFWDVLTMIALLPRLAQTCVTPADVGADVLRVARHTQRRSGDAAACDQLTHGRAQLNWQGELELARLLKRRGDVNAAAQIWQDWAERGCVEAIEAHVKHLEHAQRDYAAALQWTQRLIDAQPHQSEHALRHARLQRKWLAQRQAPGKQAPP